MKDCRYTFFSLPLQDNEIRVFKLPMSANLFINFRNTLEKALNTIEKYFPEQIDLLQIALSKHWQNDSKSSATNQVGLFRKRSVLQTALVFGLMSKLSNELHYRGLFRIQSSVYDRAFLAINLGILAASLR